MALSLVVLLIPVFLVVVAYRALQGGDQPLVVDPGPKIAEAQAGARFPVSVPQGLSSGWRPLSAVYTTTADGATLRIGYLAPGGSGVQLVESSVPTDRLLVAELGDKVAARGTVDVDGRQWQRYGGRPGETALVLAEPGRTVVVVGAGSETDLYTLATSLL
jgi:hypothetical protein